MPDTKEIQVLPQDVANMIAAGEVVERPCSVVKELLENAVDAGATAITIEIEKGGSQSIRVTDNGSGIPPDQLERAFLRHATSKLRTAEHLAQIATLGFRGEALAAIAAVSKIKVTSATKDSELALSLELMGGELQNAAEIATPVGTTMLVEDLFFNTPARKKFMKSDRSEGTAIYSLVQELALSHPEISIKFIRDGKEEMKTPGDGTLESVIFHVLGKNIAAGLREVSLVNQDSKVHGFVSLPSCCRPSRNFQHFFVNGRYIKSPMLMAALEEAYKNQKMVGRFPAAVLHISVNFDEVDVNVHPAKTQVKFAHEKEVFQLVYRGILNGLNQYSDIQKVELENDTTKSNHSDSTESNTIHTPMALPTESQPNQDLETFTKEIPKKAPLMVSSPIAMASRTDKNMEISMPTRMNLDEKPKNLPKIDYNFGILGDLEEDSDSLSSIQEENLPIATPEGNETEKEETALTLGSEKGVIPQKTQKKDLISQDPISDFVEIPLENTENEKPWRVVGEFFRTYIAVEVGDEIFLVDKHAAHERMNFERLKSQDYKPMAQVLMKPIVVQVSPEEMGILMENQGLLAEFSFEIEEFSLQTVLVREAPYDIPVEKVAETLVELARKLISGHFPDPSSARDHLLHSIACKSAIKAGYLTGEEEQNLLAQIVMDEKVRHCPHGRPIVASLSKKDLEKRFKRIT